MPNYEKDLQISLRFQAETQQARKEINDLRKELDDLTTNTTKGMMTKGFDKELNQSLVTVQKVKAALENSFDPKIGTTNITKFRKELEKSGTTVSDIRTEFSRLGDAGVQAYTNIGKALTSAQKPIQNTQTLLQKTWETLVRTAKWQAANAAVRAFGQAVSGAYQYAQDLDKSLNSIRIVTGDSADKMAQFADQANKASKQLSTSTLAYTDAALIYYQQGRC